MINCFSTYFEHPTRAGILDELTKEQRKWLLILWDNGKQYQRERETLSPEDDVDYQRVLAHLAQETQEKLEASGYFIDSRIIDDLRYSEEAESWTKPDDR